MDVRVDEALWASSMMPEGSVERWLASDNAAVSAGDPLVLIRIEDALHEIVAPAAGRLVIAAAVNDVIEPGAMLGWVVEAA